MVADAVQLGRCTLNELADELRNGPIKGSAMFRSVLAEVADGIRSTAEGDLRDLIRTARLPMPLFNPSLYLGDTFLAKPDAWWPDAGVAAEVDSREWHLSPEHWDRTRHRHTLMGAVGIIPLHFSPHDIRTDPATVIKRIKDALESGLNRPPLPIRTVPCSARESMNVTSLLKRVNTVPHSLVSRPSTPARSGPVCVECTTLGRRRGARARGGAGGRRGQARGGGGKGGAGGPGAGGRAQGGASGASPAPGRGSSLPRLAGGPRSGSAARGSA